MPIDCEKKENSGCLFSGLWLMLYDDDRSTLPSFGELLNGCVTTDCFALPRFGVVIEDSQLGNSSHDNKVSASVFFVEAFVHRSDAGKSLYGSFQCFERFFRWFIAPVEACGMQLVASCELSKAFVEPSFWGFVGTDA